MLLGRATHLEVIRIASAVRIIHPAVAYVAGILVEGLMVVRVVSLRSVRRDVLLSLLQSGHATDMHAILRVVFLA